MPIDILVTRRRTHEWPTPRLLLTAWDRQASFIALIICVNFRCNRPWHSQRLVVVVVVVPLPPLLELVEADNFGIACTHGLHLVISLHWPCCSLSFSMHSNRETVRGCHCERALVWMVGISGTVGLNINDYSFVPFSSKRVFSRCPGGIQAA